MRNLITLFTILCAFNVFAQEGTDLFFSEYVEGMSQNKALEIYNPTSETISLDGYSIGRFVNGAAVISETLPIQLVDGPNEIEPYGTIVITNGQTVENDYGVVDPELFAMGDMHCAGVYPTVMYFNGNDAIALMKDNNTVLVDLIGKIGQDPGEGWCDQDSLNYQAGDYYWLSWTSNHTLVRKSSVTQGVTTNPDYFNPAEQWELKPLDYWTDLGNHSFTNAPMMQFAVLDGVEPVSNARIEINGQILYTDSLGLDSLHIGSGDYTYKVSKAGYAQYINTVSIDTLDVVDTIYLTQSAPYELAFQLTDYQGENVDGAIISIGGIDLISDSVGYASIMLDTGIWDFNIQAFNQIDYNGNVHVTDENIALNIELEPVEYNFTAKVFNNEEVLDGALLDINGGVYVANSDGQVSVDLPYGTYPFNITKDGFVNWNDTVTLIDDSVYLEINLFELFTVTFTVLVDDQPMPNAELVVDSLVEVTDSTGKAYFNLINGTYDVVVSLEGFVNEEDTFIVNGEDLNITIATWTGVQDDNLNNNFVVYPNPTSGSIMVESNQGSLIEIVNSVGQIIHTEYSNVKNIISIESKGFYFIRIRDKNKIHTEKIIVE